MKYVIGSRLCQAKAIRYKERYSQLITANRHHVSGEMEGRWAQQKPSWYHTMFPVKPHSPRNDVPGEIRDVLGDIRL